jgi:hypothetical protein
VTVAPLVKPVLILTVALLVAAAQPALAHDCSSPADCEQTAGYNAVIAVAGGALALASGLIGNAVGGSEAPADQGAGAGPPRKRRGCCLGWFTMILALPLTLVALAVRAVGVFG